MEKKVFSLLLVEAKLEDAAYNENQMALLAEYSVRQTCLPCRGYSWTFFQVRLRA